MYQSVPVIFILILTEYLVLTLGQNRSIYPAIEKNEVLNEQSSTETTIFASLSTSSNITAKLGIHRENVTTRQILRLNFNDGDGDIDGDTSYESTTVYQEIENRRELSEPLSKDEIIQQGFANVTHKLEEIECMFSTVALFSSTVFLSQQIARLTRYIYHKLRGDEMK